MLGRALEQKRALVAVASWGMWGKKERSGGGDLELVDDGVEDGRSLGGGM